MSLKTTISGTVEGVGIALESIRANKVRAGLTILGVSVGVFVVVAIGAMITGINNAVTKDLAAAGPTTFYVSRAPISFEACDGSEDTCKWRSNPRLTIDDAQTFRALPGIRAVITSIGTGASARYRGQFLSSVSVQSFSTDWLLVDGGTIATGRSWTDAEDKAGAKVVVMNKKAVEQLFGDSDPLGKQLILGSVPFDVIGTYDKPLNPLGNDNDVTVFVPMQAAISGLNAQPRWVQISVRPRDGVARDQAIDDVTAALRGKRRLRPAEENNFAIITQDKILEVYDKVVGTFFLVMLSLSAVGLLVGGVGVIAIMMISVTERTREIGVRKALGATAGLILWQFLVEAATLTGIGGAIGLALGALVALVVRSNFPIPAEIPLISVVAAIGGSIFTGVLFGIIPAFRAARLDPVVALRYE
ncbi:MAG TPA: ABC transporter permease [Gemmatimonadaceae bacterium]|nr:ABC transporter permease [Gemmatimonadaceae bacterium]